MSVENERVFGVVNPCRFADGFLELRDPALDGVIQIDQAVIRSGEWINTFREDKDLIRRVHGVVAKLHREKELQMFEYQKQIAAGVVAGLISIGRDLGLELNPIDKD